MLHIIYNISLLYKIIKCIVTAFYIQVIHHQVKPSVTWRRAKYIIAHS